MASLPREREKNKQLQASYSTSIVQRIIQKFFLLSFLFLASGGGGGGAPFSPVMYICMLLYRGRLKTVWDCLKIKILSLQYFIILAPFNGVSVKL